MKRIKVIKKNLITLRDYTLVGPQRGNMVSVIKKKCHDLNIKIISTVKPLITIDKHTDPQRVRKSKISDPDMKKRGKYGKSTYPPNPISPNPKNKGSRGRVNKKNIKQ